MQQDKINYRMAYFSTSASRFSQCPQDQGAEVAFAGRSNAGKSSALNALTGIRLARISKTPGCTRLINFFNLDVEQCRLVDLPGYGYAKVSNNMKKEWQQNLDAYLQYRHSLKGLVLVMDIRHPLKEFDQMLIEWAHASAMPIHILLTKMDKLKKNLARSKMLSLGRQFAEDELVTVQLFSALKKTGISELQQKLNQWLLEDQCKE